MVDPLAKVLDGKQKNLWCSFYSQLIYIICQMYVRQAAAPIEVACVAWNCACTQATLLGIAGHHEVLDKSNQAILDWQGINLQGLSKSVVPVLVHQQQVETQSQQQWQHAQFLLRVPSVFSSSSTSKKAVWALTMS